MARSPQGAKTAGKQSYDVTRAIYQARCNACRARLFDTREPWQEVSAREGILLIQCWRCRTVRSLAPTRSIQENTHGSQETHAQRIRAIQEGCQEGQGGGCGNGREEAPAVAEQGQEEVNEKERQRKDIGT